MTSLEQVACVCVKGASAMQFSFSLRLLPKEIRRTSMPHDKNWDGTNTETESGRRGFLKTVATAATAALGGLLLKPDESRAEFGETSTADAAVKALYESL